MTVKELHQLFNRFVDNDFKHVRERVDELFDKLDKNNKLTMGVLVGIILLLAGLVANLIVK